MWFLEAMGCCFLWLVLHGAIRMVIETRRMHRQMQQIIKSAPPARPPGLLVIRGHLVRPYDRRLAKILKDSSRPGADN